MRLSPLAACAAWLCAACASLLLAACASTPPFHPSRPLESSRSLQEGLILCSEYHVPLGDKRTAALKPMLKCLDELADLHPPQSADGVAGDFAVFRDELHLVYDTAGDGWGELDNQATDGAAHAVLRALWRQGNGTWELRPIYTPEERELALRLFPRVSERLGAKRWAVSDRATLDPRLESLKAGLAALADGKGEREASTIPSDAAERTAELCRRYLRLRSEADYLGALRQDQRDMSQMKGAAAEVGQAVAERYASRLNAALQELEDLRPQIAEARANGSFRVLACKP